MRLKNATLLDYAVFSGFLFNFLPYLNGVSCQPTGGLFDFIKLQNWSITHTKTLLLLVKFVQIQ